MSQVRSQDRDTKYVNECSGGNRFIIHINNLKNLSHLKHNSNL